MSSVGSSDSTGSSSSSGTPAEVIRRNREEAQRNETELVKKHQKEIRRINEEHYAEMENLKSAHESQIANLKKGTHEEVSERDHQYQQEIEDLRGLYKKQLQNQADETNKRDDAVKLAKTVDNGNDKSQADKRFKMLTEEYEKNMDKREKTFNEVTDQNREAQHNAIDANREKMTKHFDEENRFFQEDRKNQVEGLQKGYSDYRQMKEEQIREQNIRHMQEKQRDSDNLLHAVNKERTAASDSNEYLREGFKDGLAKTRERFEKSYGRDRAAGDIGRQQMKDTVNDRIDNEVNRLKMEKADLQDNKVRTEMSLKQQQHREMGDLADSYQKNLDNYQMQRDAAVTSNTDRVHREVGKVRKELGDEAVTQNRFYRTEENLQNRINRTALDNMKGDFEAHNEQTKLQANTRVKNILEATTDTQTRMINTEAENHTASQRAHQDEMIALRTTVDEDKRSAVNILKEQMQKQELQHSERMTMVVGKYEKQIQTLKDQLIREKRQNEENVKRAVEEMQRSHKTSIDQLEAQTSGRMHQADAIHNDELRALNKRNDEKINQILAEVKKS